MHTGSIIDFYDDPNGLVLKTKMASEQVPGFIKTAQFLEEEHREKLPDDVYALVMIDQGAKFRKYACVDKGNTALSVIYFLENKDKLPEEAQKVAAANLLTACRWYDMQPPAPLMKMAGIGGMLNAGLGAMTVKDRVGQGMARHAKVMGKAPGIPKIGDLTGSNVMPLSNDTEKTAGIYQPDLPRARDVIKGRGPAKRAERSALRDKLRSTHPAGAPRYIDEGMSDADRSKAVDLFVNSPSGKRAVNRMVRELKSGSNTLTGPFGDKYDMHVVKKASALNPYVDITGKSAPPIFEKVAHQRFALVKEGQSRFPIDTYGDVLEADRWFNDHGESLHPEERRSMCIKLAARADEIGCKVTDYVKKYAGVGYAPDGEVRVAVSTRMQYFQDDSPERDMLNGLMNKYAHVTPSVFCEAIRQFDESTGLDYHWDDGVYDPWYTTYGFTKTAEWEFSTHGDKINEEQLKQVVNAGYSIIVKKFGADMADELKKSPVQIFDSLPLDTKRIIMRMANDPQPSPFVVQP
jgi:hypothetical protein